MRVTTSKSKNSESFYITRSYVGANGKTTSTTVRKLGSLKYLSDMLGTDRDGVMVWAKEQARIETENYNKETEDQAVLIPFHCNQLLDYGQKSLFEGGYLFLQSVYYQLRLDYVCKKIRGRHRFDYDLNAILSDLVYARMLDPQSKSSSFKAVQNYLEAPSYKLHDVYRSLSVLAQECDFIQAEAYKNSHFLGKRNDGILYYDCTNYYFEIDKESTLQKRGPSKENRRDPIVGMGLLLDAQMLPVGMKIFPGNESEKPVMRDLIHDLKSRNNIKGRTIQIADKGLNCAKNIIEAIDNGDGYLFSKSVKTLPERERQWVLLDDGFETVFDQNGEPVYKIKECIDTFTYSYKDEYGNVITRNIKEKRTVTYNFSLAKKKLMEINRMIEKAKAHRACQAKKEEYGESSKYMQFLDDQGKSIKPQLNQKAIDKDKELAGYNMLVTSEINMSSKDIYNAYHQLWQIEESFRIMKSELDTRPVYLQKENRIKGHFFICYTAVLLSRILQFKILENKYSASTIYDFMRKFRVVRINSTRFINLLTSKEFVTDLSKKLNQPITNYYLTDKQIKMMHTR